MAAILLSAFILTSHSRRSVGIDAALDLGDALVVADEHSHDGDGSSHEDSADRNQQWAQTQNRVD
jgi:hypothetical protein